MIVRGVSRLGLGTAQFGLAYGITNPAGQLDQAEAAAILTCCADAGISTLDTAHLYGDSEAVIGRCSQDPAFQIVTKTPKFGDIESEKGAAELLRTAFNESLARLRRRSIHALLIHDAGDLSGPWGRTIWKEMEALKAAGLAGKIGVSVYEGSAIDEAIKAYQIDIVQLPWNPLDSRLKEGGQLERLADQGIEVHARSLFLQGLLLQDVEQIDDRFAPVKEAVRELDRCSANAEIGRLEAILAIAFNRPEITRFIVGVTSAAQLAAIIEATKRAQDPSGLQLPEFDLDPIYLNPSRWDELG